MAPVHSILHASQGSNVLRRHARFHSGRVVGNAGSDRKITLMR
jgi:hypothetical protein